MARGRNKPGSRATAALQKKERKRQKQQNKLKEKNKKNNKKIKNQNGENGMFGLGDTVKKAVTTFGRQTLPSSTATDYDTLNIVLFDQSTLDRIAAICLPAAGGSEFQVHYRGLQVIAETVPAAGETDHQRRRIVFTIPTVFFNFPQTVTTGSVNFNLDEVAEISEQVIPISDALVNTFIQSFPIQRFKDRGFNVSVREQEMGSMHRHPGNFGFSQIDLDNKADNPGVIFRNLECDDKIQTDSVMYIPNQTVQIVCTETRVVDVAPVENGIEGSYARTATKHYILENVKIEDSFEDFFDGGAVNEVKFLTKNDKISEDYPEIEKILREFVIATDYQPQVIVAADNIKSHSYTYPGYNRSGVNYGGHGKNKSFGHNYGGGSIYNYLDDDEDEYWPAHKAKTQKTQTPVTTTAHSTAKSDARSLTRPTWRKRQTLSVLAGKGVKVAAMPEIDGSASDQDIIAIAKALKENSFTDVQIRGIFRGFDYPSNSLEIYYQDLHENTKEEQGVLEVTDTKTSETTEVPITVHKSEEAKTNDVATIIVTDTEEK